MRTDFGSAAGGGERGGRLSRRGQREWGNHPRGGRGRARAEGTGHGRQRGGAGSESGSGREIGRAIGGGGSRGGREVLAEETVDLRNSEEGSQRGDVSGIRGDSVQELALKCCYKIGRFSGVGSNTYRCGGGTGTLAREQETAHKYKQISNGMNLWRYGFLFAEDVEGGVNHEAKAEQTEMEEIGLSIAAVTQKAIVEAREENAGGEDVGRVALLVGHRVIGASTE